MADGNAEGRLGAFFARPTGEPVSATGQGRREPTGEPVSETRQMGAWPAGEQRSFWTLSAEESQHLEEAVYAAVEAVVVAVEADYAAASLVVA